LAAANGSIAGQFHFGENNRMAATAVAEILEHPGTISPLYLHGPLGCGKTELLNCLTRGGRGFRHFRRRVYISAEQFTSLFVDAIRGRGVPSFRQKFRHLDVLAIDDIQFFSNKRATLVELQHTIDCLLAQGRQLILTGDCPPNELTMFEPELIHRLQSGLVCRLHHPDETARTQILQTICRQRGFELAPEILGFVARQITGDARQLRGAIVRLHAAALSGVDLGHWETCEKVLSDLLHACPQTISLSKIEQAVCEVCGVEASELKSPKRGQTINVARNLAMWLARKHIGAAFSDIGRHYGGRSHSTVISAHKKVADWLASDAKIPIAPNAVCPASRAVERIESRLKTG
jgi:chromosomal replication initiator protein